MSTAASERESAVDDLLLQVREGLDSGLLPARIFNDPDIHAREYKRLFSRAWSFIGHESEIPSPGDYVLRYIAEDPFIFVRDEAGEVRMFFDACRHRGVRVCRAEKGNTSHFRCSYHGWIYKNTGDFIGAPEFEIAYKGLDRSQWGLVSPAQVGSSRGFFFATMDPSAPSLEEYLGDAGWYMDAIPGWRDEELVVVGEPQRWTMPGNWKSGAENSTGDDYHTVTLHRSALEMQLVQIGKDFKPQAYHVHVGNGHTTTWSLTDGPVRDVPEAGPGVPAGQLELAYKARYMQLVIFPNLVISQFQGTAAAGATELSEILSLSMWQPRGKDTLEQWRWYLVPKATSAEQKREIYRQGIGSLGPAGIIEQDDPEPWGSIARTAGSLYTQRNDFMLNFQMGLPGIGNVQRVDFPGPGVAVTPRFEESGARAFYRRYLEFMTSDEFPAHVSSEEAATAALGSGNWNENGSAHGNGSRHGTGNGRKPGRKR